jgi:hypothetical protein
VADVCFSIVHSHSSRGSRGDDNFFSGIMKDFDVLGDHFDYVDLLFFALSTEREVSEASQERRLTLLTLLIHTVVTDPGLSEQRVPFQEASTDNLKGKAVDPVVIEA